jgi:hypothetical protein
VNGEFVFDLGSNLKSLVSEFNGIDKRLRVLFSAICEKLFCTRYYETKFWRIDVANPVDS